jgi:bifunctional DNase/RNase
LKEAEMIKVKVSGLGRHLPTGRWLLLLREERTTRCLAIVIGLVDAHAIALRLAKTKLQRPLTHNLIQNLIKALNETDRDPGCLKNKSGGQEHLLLSSPL